MIAFALLAVTAQVARNWLMLRAIGVDVSVFDAMALLIDDFKRVDHDLGHRRAATAMASRWLPASCSISVRSCDTVGRPHGSLAGSTSPDAAVAILAVTPTSA